MAATVQLGDLVSVGSLSKCFFDNVSKKDEGEAGAAVLNTFRQLARVFACTQEHELVVSSTVPCSGNSSF
jgi:hypothetical protein